MVTHEDATIWQHFLHNCPFVRGIHQYTGGFPSKKDSDAEVDVLFPSLNRLLNKQLSC